MNTYELSKRAKQYTNSLSKALKEIDKYGKPSEDLNKVTKLAKYAEAIGTASVVLEIAMGFMDHEDKKEKLLKEVIGKIDELKNQINSLQSDVNEGIGRVLNKSVFLQAQSQIFEPVALITAFVERVRSYAEAKTHSQKRRRRELLLNENEASLSTNVQKLFWPAPATVSMPPIL